MFQITQLVYVECEAQNEGFFPGSGPQGSLLCLTLLESIPSASYRLLLTPSVIISNLFTYVWVSLITLGASQKPDYSQLWTRILTAPLAWPL